MSRPTIVLDEVDWALIENEVSKRPTRSKSINGASRTSKTEVIIEHVTRDGVTYEHVKYVTTPTEWDPKWIEYAKVQIDGRWLRTTICGTVRENRISSNDHIANVILRQYVRKIRPFPAPMGREYDIPEEVWKYLVQSVGRQKERLSMWEDLKTEMWNRPWPAYHGTPKVHKLNVKKLAGRRKK